MEVAEDPATCDGVCPDGALDHFLAIMLLPGLHFCGSNEQTYTLDKVCLAHCEGAVHARYPSCDLSYEDYLVSTNMAPELIARIVCTGGGTMSLATRFKNNVSLRLGRAFWSCVRVLRIRGM